jgi:hypothetical protein
MVGRIRTTGVLIVVLGAWGGLVPFIGPYFGFGAGTPAWTWTRPFATLNVVAGAVAVIGGLLLLSATRSRLASLGGLLAVGGGMWFVLGPVFQPLWHQTSSLAVDTTGPTWMQVAKVLGYHDGTGLLIAVLAGYALGVVSDLRRTVAATPVAPAAPVTTTQTEVHEAA